MRQYTLYLGRRTRTGSLEVKRLYFSGPGNAPRRSSLAWVETLNLSPNGKYLLLNYSDDSFPDDWKSEPLVKQLIGFGTRAETHVLGLYEVATGRLRVGFNYPGVFLVETSWSNDSRAYSVVSPAPFGTPDAVEEARGNASNARTMRRSSRSGSGADAASPLSAASTSLMRASGAASAGAGSAAAASTTAGTGFGGGAGRRSMR